MDWMPANFKRRPERPVKTGKAQFKAIWMVLTFKFRLYVARAAM